MYCRYRRNNFDEKKALQNIQIISSLTTQKRLQRYKMAISLRRSRRATKKGVSDYNVGDIVEVGNPNSSRSIVYFACLIFREVQTIIWIWSRYRYLDFLLWQAIETQGTVITNRSCWYYSMVFIILFWLTSFHFPIQRFLSVSPLTDRPRARCHRKRPFGTITYRRPVAEPTMARKIWQPTL